MTGRAATRAVRTITEIARVITRIVRAAIRTVRVVSRIARSVTRTARAATRTVRMLTRGSHLRRIPRLRETIRTARLRAACRIPREFRRAQEPIRLVTRQETGAQSYTAEPKADLQDLDSGIEANGILEVMPDGFGFIRCENFLPGDNDVYVAPSQIRRFNMKTGDIIRGSRRVKSATEKFAALLYVKTESTAIRRVLWSTARTLRI